MPLALYISHPQVVIDPAVSVPDWRLSDEGRARLAAISNEPWVRRLQAIMTSPERKARETADILSATSLAPVQIVETSAEIDWSATGYVPHAEHERLANALFADPERSPSGWERGIDAQRRIVAAVDGFLASHRDKDHVVIAGHGGVGTLLSCALRGIPPARSQDQPHGGCVFAWDTETRAVLFTWTPLEAVAKLLS